MQDFIATHDGEFHADDVCAVAVLLSLYPTLQVIRTREKYILEKAKFVVDVGGSYDHAKGWYDHHKKNESGKRANGIPYAAIGLVWRHYGKEFCNGSEEVGTWVDRNFIQAIDATDVGMNIFEPTVDCAIPTINSLVQMALPTRKEEKEYDSKFTALVLEVQKIFQRIVVVGESIKEAKQYVIEAIKNSSDTRVITLHTKLPWHEVLDEHPEVLFVQIPDSLTEGAWRAYAVRSSYLKFEARKPFPEAWAGLCDEELSQVTKVKGSRFCHLSRHLVVADSFVGIQKLVQLALLK